MNRLTIYLRAKGHTGEAKAIKRIDLARALGTSIREVRALAEEARLAGEFVGYSTHSRRGGIYLAETSDERMGIYRRVRAECIHRLRQHRSLRRALMNLHQGELFRQAT